MCSGTVFCWTSNSLVLHYVQTGRLVLVLVRMFPQAGQVFSRKYLCAYSASEKFTQDI